MSEFDEERIKEVSEILADPTNTLLLLLSKSIKESILNETHEWFNINFRRDKLTAKELADLKAPTLDAFKTPKRLDFPPPNYLMPKNFEILPPSPEHSKEPIMIKTFPNANLWYKKDDKFGKPKGQVAIEIATNDLDFRNNPKSAMFAKVWLNCLKEYTEEFCYTAVCAEMSFSQTLGNDSVIF